MEGLPIGLLNEQSVLREMLTRVRCHYMNFVCDVGDRFLRCEQTVWLSLLMCTSSRSRPCPLMVDITFQIILTFSLSRGLVAQGYAKTVHEGGMVG